MIIKSTILFAHQPVRYLRGFKVLHLDRDPGKLGDIFVNQGLQDGDALLVRQQHQVKRELNKGKLST